MKRTYILLGLIILLGAILRLWGLTSTPQSLYWDEVSIGYNAYSIAETGHDEHGNAFPLIFKGYDDYKFPGQIYLTVPFVKLLDLTDLSTRLPSALMGIVALPALFFLTRSLLKKGKIKNDNVIALLATLMLAISPWHIQFSRAAFEANTALTFLLIGLALIFYQKKVWQFALGLLFLLLSLYTYRSELLFIPPILALALILFRHDYFKKKTTTIVLLGIFAVLAIPIYYYTFFGEAAVRGSQVSIFSEAQDNIGNTSQIVIDNAYQPVGKTVLNYRLTYLDTFLENYFPNLSSEFLFISGDENGRHGPRMMGLLYLWEIIFIALGAFFLTRFDKRILIFVLAWIMIAPLSASLSTPSPHALRTLNNAPIFAIITGVGLFFGYEIFKKYRYIYIGLVSFIILFFFVKYLYLYFVITPSLTNDVWGGGYKEIVNYTLDNSNNYDEVVVTGEYWNPYMYYLFYTLYPPKNFQESGSVVGFDRYTFGGTSWDNARHSKTLNNLDPEKLEDNKVLFILSPSEFDSNKANLKEIKRITNSNGKVTFVIAEKS